MKKRWKKLTEEVIHENPWWVYKHDTFERHDGVTGDYYYGEENGMALVIPIKENGKLVFTLQYRYLEDKQSIEFPGGGIQVGETAVVAAERELREETGFTGEEFIYLGHFQSISGFFRSQVHVFICKVGTRAEQQLDETEDIEVMERTPQEFEDMVKKNEIWDGQTLAAWALAQHHL